jgi:hypothetical protein
MDGLGGMLYTLADGFFSILSFLFIEIVIECKYRRSWLLMKLMLCLKSIFSFFNLEILVPFVSHSVRTQNTTTSRSRDHQLPGQENMSLPTWLSDHGSALTHLRSIRHHTTEE